MFFCRIYLQSCCLLFTGFKNTRRILLVGKFTGYSAGCRGELANFPGAVIEMQKAIFQGHSDNHPICEHQHSAKPDLLLSDWTRLIRVVVWWTRFKYWIVVMGRWTLVINFTAQNLSSSLRCCTKLVVFCITRYFCPCVTKCSPTWNIDHSYILPLAVKHRLRVLDSFATMRYTADLTKTTCLSAFTRKLRNILWVIVLNNDDISRYTCRTAHVHSSAMTCHPFPIWSLS